MPWKTDDSGSLVSIDGSPVWVHDDGKEAAFDAGSALKKITDLNAESAGHRRERNAAQERLSTFSGIDDPQAALDAIEKMKNFDQNKLVDAGKLDELKAQLTKELNEKLATKDSELGSLNQALHREMIGGRFSRSKFVNDRLAIPSDMVEGFFGRHFTIDGGKVIAKDSSGNIITSHENFGEPAGFDEALESLVNKYPGKDQILKATGSTGSGAKGSTTTGGGVKTIQRSDQAAFNANLEGIADGSVQIVG